MTERGSAANIPTNRFKEIFFDCITQKQVESAVKELVAIALNGSQDKIQLGALTYLFDRLMGKPATSEIVEHEGEVNVNITRRDGRTKEQFDKVIAAHKVIWAQEHDALGRDEVTDEVPSTE